MVFTMWHSELTFKYRYGLWRCLIQVRAEGGVVEQSSFSSLCLCTWEPFNLSHIYMFWLLSCIVTFDVSKNTQECLPTITTPTFWTLSTVKAMPCIFGCNHSASLNTIHFFNPSLQDVNSLPWIWAQWLAIFSSKNMEPALVASSSLQQDLDTDYHLLLHFRREKGSWCSLSNAKGGAPPNLLQKFDLALKILHFLKQLKHNWQWQHWSRLNSSCFSEPCYVFAVVEPRYFSF